VIDAIRARQQRAGDAAGGAPAGSSSEAVRGIHHDIDYLLLAARKRSSREGRIDVIPLPLLRPSYAD
jgi:hypothetical protein